MKVAVTTSHDDKGVLNQAQAIAAELAIEFLPRRRKSLDGLRQEYGLDYVLVVEKEQIVLKGETSIAWHPGMAVPRLKALRQGKTDPLVEALGLREGDRVLDCTLGLASDALVCAYAVGTTGSVTGLEANPYLAFITRWGLKNFNGQNTHVREVLRRISVLHADYEKFLCRQPDDSFDVVYFDPMFRQGLTQSSSMNAIRPLAKYNPVSEAALQEALRVAERKVVLKEKAGSTEFERLKPDRHGGGKYSPVAYGIWEKSEAFPRNKNSQSGNNRKEEEMGCYR